MTFKGATAVISIRIEPRFANAIGQSLKGDADVSNKNGTVTLRIDAGQLSKLRANINSNLRLIKSTLDTLEEADNI